MKNAFRRSALLFALLSVAVVGLLAVSAPQPASAATITMTATCGDASYVGGRLRQEFNVTIEGPALGANQVFETSGITINSGTFYYFTTSPTAFETPYPYNGTIIGFYADDIFSPTTPPTNPPGGSSVQYFLGGYVVDKSQPPNSPGYIVHSGSVTPTCSVPFNGTPLTASNFTLDAVSGQTRTDTLESYIDGGAAPFSYSIVTPPTNGTVTLATSPQSSVLVGQYTYRTNKGTAGTDSFVYQVRDAEGTTRTGTATVNYTAPPALVAPNRTLDVAYNGGPETLTLGSTGGISPKTISLVTTSPSSKGTFSLSGTTFTYTPGANQTGPDTITYRVVDSTDPAQNVTGTITVTIAPPPVVAGDTGPLDVEYEGSATGDVASLTTGGLAPRSYTIETQPAKGTVTLNSTTGAFTYEANDGVSGADSFVYRATDASDPALSDTGTVSFAIEPAPLVAEDGTITVVAGTSQSLDLGTLVDGGTMPYSYLVSSPAKGTAILTVSTVTYVADADNRGTDTFTYTVTDAEAPTAQTATGTITVTITDPPIVITDPVPQSVEAGQSFTLDLATIASGGTAPLAFAIETNGGKGTGSIEGTVLTYAANAADRGADSVEITVTDASDPAQSDTFTVPISITAPDLVLAGDTASVVAGQSVDIDIAGLISGGTAPFTVSIETQGSKGTATVEDLTVTYTANAADRGADPVVIRVTDASNPEQSETATITITITAPPLVLTPVEQSVTAGQPITVDLAGFVSGGTPAFAYSITSDPGAGPASISGSELTFTPNADVRGEVSFEFEVIDSSDPEQTEVATLVIDVLAPELVVADTSASVTAGESVSVDLAPLISGGTGPFTASIESDGGKGSSDVTGLSVTYTANAADRGADTVTVAISDSSDPVQEKTLDIAITILAPELGMSNPAQTVTAGETLTLDLLTLVTGGTPGFSFSITDDVDQGSASISGSTLSYTPEASYRGGDSITIQVTDGSDPVQTTSATLAITVTAPALIADSPPALLVLAGTSESIDLAGLVDGGTEPYSLAIDTDGAKGDGSLAGTTLTYAADAGSRGADSVIIAVSDASNPQQSGTITVSIIVTAPDLIVSDTSASVTAGASVSLDLSPLVSGGTAPYTYAVGAQGGKGSASLSGATLTYTADADARGGDTVEITVSDASDPQQSKTITVSIAIAAPDLATSNGSLTVGAGASKSLNLGSLVAGGTGPFSYSVSSGGGKGTASISGATLTYKANAASRGADTVTVAVSDASDPQQTGSITVSVTITAPTLVAGSGSLNVTYNTSGSINLAALVGGGTSPYTITISKGPASGKVTLSGGKATYTPAAGFSGTDSFTYKVTDSSSPTQAKTGVIAVKVGPAPSQKVNITGDPRFPITGSATVPGQSGLTYALGAGPSRGSVTVNANGSFTYVATNTKAAGDSFTVIARFANGNTITVTVTITFTVDPSVPTQGTVKPGGTGGGGSGSTPRDPRSNPAPAPTPTPPPVDDDDGDDGSDCARCN